MKWYRNTWSIYYGGGSPTGSITINDIVMGPYLYNGELYGTAERPIYSLFLQSSILDQAHRITPVNGAESVNYEYYRVVGVPDDKTISSTWGSEIEGDTISGQYKFRTSLSGTTFLGWSIPCNFIITKSDGTTFVGDSLQSTGYNNRFPTTTSCGMVCKNIKQNTSVYYGSTDSNDTTATLTADLQYSIIDFGDKPQEIPKFIKIWIENNAYVVGTPKSEIGIEMKSRNGIMLHTEGKYCDRNIRVYPKLQSKSVTPSSSSQSITMDSGYAGLSEVTVSAVPTEIKTITAGTSATTVTPTSGKFISSVTVNPTPTEEKTVTPTTSAQTITPTSGKYISKVEVGAVTSAIDNNIVAENIKKDVTILGVTGTLESGTSGVPIDVATADEMSALLVADNVGKVYKFTGTTDSTYTNGDLYEVVSE